MNLTEFQFQKGRHFSRPLINPILHPSTNKISAYVMFTEKSIYTCKDQMDWNKLCGLSWGFPFNKNAVMWAYRWNTDINSFQLSPYVNANGEQFYLDGNVEPFKIDLGIKYILTIEIEKHKPFSKVLFKCFSKEYKQGFRYKKETNIDFSSLLVTRRRPYHGGNTTPNNDYTVFAKL
jgi:hypothetical protein